jgi:phage terminase small subunit
MTQKKKKLTVKEQKLIKGIAAGKSQTQAAKDAGYSPKSAHVIATNTLNKVNVQEALQVALTKHGITLDTAIAPIGKGLHAVKQNEYTGEITEDIKTQMQASDRALKLMGVSNPEGTTVNINFNQVSEKDRGEFGIQ